MATTKNPAPAPFTPAATPPAVQPAPTPAAPAPVAPTTTAPSVVAPTAPTHHVEGQKMPDGTEVPKPGDPARAPVPPSQQAQNKPGGFPKV